MVKEGIDLSYNSNDYLSQPLKDMLKGVLNHDGRTSIDQLLQAQDWNITTNNTLQDEIKDWNVASNSFLQDEIKDWNVASNSFLQDEIKDWNVASNSFLQDEIKDWNVASNSFLQDEIKDWNVASNSFLQDEIKDWNVASNSFLQDEIKDRHDAQAKLEKERDNLATEKQRLVRKNKRYKNKLSKARSHIDSQLKRPLQANDFKYPYSVDATNQTLLAIRKLL